MLNGTSVSLGLAFLAGLASFLSPCVLPIVPSFLGYVTGLSLEELREGGPAGARRHTLVHAGTFVLGFSALFVALGASATALGGVLREALPWLQRLGGVVIFVFGLYLLGVLRIPALSRERRLHLARRPAGAVGSFAVGVAFGAGWTPCIGPVLATVLLYASFEHTLVRGVLLLSAYALGLAIPFLLAALALNSFLAAARRVRNRLVWIERGTGAVLVLLGLLLATGHFADLTGFLSRFTPAIEVGA